MITFASREYTLFIVIVISIMIIMRIVYALKYNKALRVLLSPRSRFLLIGYHPMKQAIKLILSIIGFTLLCIALLRPQIEKDPMKIKQEGWNVLVALDISRSMRSSDIDPSRLSAAKEKIKHLIQSLECTRLGLVLFSQDAFVQCPLTNDLDAFLLFLDPVDSETVSGASTALDRALIVSLDTLKNISENKIILLLTDGEDFSQDLSSIKKESKAQNILLCALGIGTPAGAPIPILDEQGGVIGYEKDAAGHIVISRLNEQMLRDLSQDLDGLYISMTADNSDIYRIKRFIETQKKGRFDDKAISMNFDFYPFFLLGGIICLLLEWIL